MSAHFELKPEVAAIGGHEHRAHSKLGASGYYRWGVCPGSVRLSEGMPNESSEHAAQGSVAHECGEAFIHAWVTGTPYAGHPFGATVKHSGHDIVVDDDMLRYAKLYADAVIKEACRPGAQLFVERRLDLSSIHPKMYGTADAIVVNTIERRIYVFDFKYGVRFVDEEGNEQLLFYALGALIETQAAVDEVVINIVQPRSWMGEPVRSWSLSMMEMFDFAEDLRAAALATDDPNAPFVPGLHCDYCPAAPVCAALRDYCLDAASQMQPIAEAVNRGETPKYDPQKLGELLLKKPVITGWLNAVERFLKAEAIQGRGSPLHKLVPTRAERSFRDPSTVVDYIELIFGVPRDDLYTKPVPALRSPAQIEQTLKDRGFSAKERKALEAYIQKDSNGYSLAPLDDKRAAATPEASSMSLFPSVATPTE
jgi:hypothetical protein